MGKAAAAAAIQACSVRRTSSIIASSIDLTGATVELVDQQEREYFLKRALPAPRGQASTTSSSTARRRWACSP